MATSEAHTKIGEGVLEPVYELYEVGVHVFVVVVKEGSLRSWWSCCRNLRACCSGTRLCLALFAAGIVMGV